MGSMNKVLSESEKLRKSLGFMEKHMSALQEFQKNYSHWQDEYKNASAIQTAGKELLAMQGINKNILGLQSIFEQSSLKTNSAMAEYQRIPKDFLPAIDAFKQTGIQALKNESASAMAEYQRILKDFLPASDAFKQTGIQALKNESASAMAEYQRIPKDFLPASDAFKQTGIQALKNESAAAIVEQHKILRQNPLRDMVEKMGLSSSLGGMLDLIAEQSKLERGSALRSIIGNSDFLSQISRQSPFISAVQSQMPKMEKIFGSTSVVMAMANSEPLMSSILPVTTASLNFSSELERLSVTEQQRVVDILEQLNLDDESDIVMPEEISNEIQNEYISLLEFIRAFGKTNHDHLLGIMTTVETSVVNFSTMDFSNPFTVIAFVYNCLRLLLNCFQSLNLNDDGDPEKRK